MGERPGCRPLTFWGCYLGLALKEDLVSSGYWPLKRGGGLYQGTPAEAGGGLCRGSEPLAKSPGGLVLAVPNSTGREREGSLASSSSSCPVIQS